MADLTSIGSTIRNGKCSWLITVALQRANKGQKETLRVRFSNKISKSKKKNVKTTFQKSYGSNEEVDVASVMGIFEDLKMPKLYKSYEEDTVRDIMDLINRMSGGAEKRTLNHRIFKNLLANIYQRN